MANTADSYGLIVFDSGGNATLRYGVAKDDDLLGQVITGIRSEKRQLVGLTQGEQSFVAASTKVDDEHTVVLIQAAEVTNELIDFLGAVDFASDILNQLLTSPFDGMTVVDADGRIVYISPVHEKFFGLARGEATGRHVTEIIQNTRLHIVAHSGQPEIGQMHEMHGKNHTISNRIVSRLPIIRDGKVLGAIGRIMFKGPDQLLAMSREISALKTEVEYYKREAKLVRDEPFDIDEIVGDSKALRQLKSDMIRIAKLDVPVLILGESGTGKELIAKAIHQLSLRSKKKLVTVNAGALPESLVESELFGYDAGAFTGARKKGRQGKFESANNSTLFLDEIGEMQLDIQVKLLRVLQDGSFEPVGSDEPKFSDFRLIAATNRDLNSMVEDERFRLDLFYRISGITLHAPPLRERLEDVPALVDHFINSFASRQRTNEIRVNPKVYSYLQRQQWPGNIRQLQHEVERALIFCDGVELKVEDFRPSGVSPELPQTRVPLPTHDEARPLKETLDQVELVTIREAMARHHNNKKRVAEELGISRSYLYKRLEDLEES